MKARRLLDFLDKQDLDAVVLRRWNLSWYRGGGRFLSSEAAFIFLH